MHQILAPRYGYNFMGTSAEVKADGPAPGAAWYEYDTGVEYVWTGLAWVVDNRRKSRMMQWNTVTLAWEAVTKGTGVGPVVSVDNFPASYPVTGPIATTSVANSTSSGIIDALAETVECTVSPGASTVGVQLTGTWAAAGDLVAFEGTVDGTNWTSIYANLTSLGSLAVFISGSNGLYQIAAAGMSKVRVRGSTWGAPGSCSVSFNSTVGSSASLLALPLPVGSNVIGKFGIDQTTPGTTNAVTVSPLTTWVSGSLTLTLATTAYLIPASEQAGRRQLILYNGSDTNMFIGSSAVAVATGILLATGATMTIDAGSGLYAVCSGAGKVLNYLEGK